MAYGRIINNSVEDLFIITITFVQYLKLLVINIKEGVVIMALPLLPIALPIVVRTIDKLMANKERNRRIAAAKRRGTTRAANVYSPTIRNLRNDIKKLKELVNKDITELHPYIESLENELLALIETHDALAQKLNRQKKFKSNKIALLGSCIGAATTENLNPESFNALYRILGIGCNKSDQEESPFTLDKCPWIAVFPSELLFAQMEDYTQYEKEQYEKQCKVWETRLAQEKLLYLCELKHYQKLHKQSMNDIDSLMKEIQSLNNAITIIRTKINFYGEL